MGVVISGNYYAEPEQTATPLVVGTQDGLCLAYNENGILIPSQSVVDGILMSEVVSELTFLQRYQLYVDIDFGPYSKLGEPVYVAKDVKDKMARGLWIATSGRNIAVGEELQLLNGVLWGNNNLPDRPKVVRIMEAIPGSADASRTGLVLILDTPIYPPPPDPGP